MPLRPLVPVLLIALPAVSSAQHPAADPQQEHARLEGVVVTATPLRQSAEELNQPVELLTGQALEDARAATLGDSVGRLPGVHAAGFGPGASRPVIRGLDGARVQTLSGGLSSLDASTVSADHTVSIEPFLAEQIEVLKGPATLLYGSGAIGGAVNVVDGRIPELLPAQPGQLSGRADLRAASGNHERSGMFRLDGGGERWAWHADGLHRDAGDIAIPGFAESAAQLAEEGEEPDLDRFGRLPNSALRSRSAAFGLSRIGDRGLFGASFSELASVYGIPGHAHHHDEHEDEGEHEGEEDAADGEPEAVRIDLRQRRFDLKANRLQPFAGHDSLQLRLARSDYRHLELEGEAVGTRFDNDGLEARLEAVHQPWAGWLGAWGLQYGRRDFRARGEEAFVPDSRSRDLGLFLIEQRPLGADWRLDLGARLDRVEIAPASAAATSLPSRRFDPFSASAALGWDASDALHVTLGLDHAERAPTAEELFSDGPHAATRGYEIGNPALDHERARRLELGLHWHHARWSAKAAIYTTRFSDFIYLIDTGEELEELPLRQWSQADARFRGIEAETLLELADGPAGHWELRLSADRVRARLDHGDRLPRIPADRLGAELRWQRDHWRASLAAVYHAEQDRVALFERPSASYTLIDTRLAYGFDRGRHHFELFLDGHNLSDREARPHTSWLKELAPLPGRSVVGGLRVFF